jgi:hypothetical protein
MNEIIVLSTSAEHPHPLAKRLISLDYMSSAFKDKGSWQTHIQAYTHTGLSDFSVRGAARRHFPRQVAQLFGWLHTHSDIGRTTSVRFISHQVVKL